MSTSLRRNLPDALNADAPVVGTLRRVTEEGIPFVDYPGSRGEIAARCAFGVMGAAPPVEACTDAPVLLVFERGDRMLPVIVGFIRDTLWPSAPGNREPVAELQQVLEGRNLVIRGDETLELRCGRGSISINAEGHIVIKGQRVTSRARETNKVRGAVVLIN
jgi:hypothetical protein